MVQYSFTSTEIIRLVWTESPGRPPRLTQLLNYVAIAYETLVLVTPKAMTVTAF